MSCLAASPYTLGHGKHDLYMVHSLFYVKIERNCVYSIGIAVIEDI